MAGDGSTRLVLIRHGEARATVDGVVGGHLGCRGLSDRGVRQVRALADRLAATGELGTVDLLVTSVLPRAIETAELIAPALGWMPASIPHNCDFCELHPGACDGMTWEEFGRVYGDPDMGANPYVPLSPGGESLAGFHLRAGRALTEVVADHPGETVVVACHGGVVGVSMVMWLGLAAFGRYVERQVDNTSLTEWVLPIPGASGRAVPRLVRFNDAAHLSGLCHRPG
jgi:2,3-bisphosphoglycerate-dependent phosphoglycerate mutase